MRIASFRPRSSRPSHGYGGTELFLWPARRGAPRARPRRHPCSRRATPNFRRAPIVLSTATWPPSEPSTGPTPASAFTKSRETPGYDAVQNHSSLGLHIACELGIQCLYLAPITAGGPESPLRGTPRMHYVAISQRRSTRIPVAPRDRHHHGLDPEGYPPTRRDDGYVLHLGRFAPEKGTPLRPSSGTRGASSDVVVPAAFTRRRTIRPTSRRGGAEARSPGLIAEGEADCQRKVVLLQRARALLCPIRWEEPFVFGCDRSGCSWGRRSSVLPVAPSGNHRRRRDRLSSCPTPAEMHGRFGAAARSTGPPAPDARASVSRPIRMAADYQRVFESMVRRDWRGAKASATKTGSSGG